MPATGQHSATTLIFLHLRKIPKTDALRVHRLLHRRGQVFRSARRFRLLARCYRSWRRNGIGRLLRMPLAKSGCALLPDWDWAWPGLLSRLVDFYSGGPLRANLPSSKNKVEKPTATSLFPSYKDVGSGRHVPLSNLSHSVLRLYPLHTLIS